LFVEKGDRYASVSKTCTVVPAPPKYGIRWVLYKPFTRVRNGFWKVLESFGN
jgi:hypothetical protein